MRSHRRGSRRTAGQRRKLVWCTTDADVALTANQSSCLSLLAGLSVAGATHLGVTVMRTHIRMSPSTTPALGDNMYFGLLIGRSLDVGTAIAGQPDPSLAANADLDWMYINKFYAAPNFGDDGSSNILTLDNRSKRVMQELNQAYFLCFHSGMAAAVTWHVFARTLVALP